MSNSRHLIVDGSNLLHRILHVPKLKMLRDVRGRFTGGQYGVLKSLRMTIEQQEIDGLCVVVWDHGHSKRRMKLFKGYKERPERKVEKVDGIFFDYSKQFKLQRAAINVGLRSLGVRIAGMPGREADDVIAKLLAFFENEVVIATEDKDFYQLISRNVSVWRPMLGVLFDEGTFIEDQQFKPRFWIYFRAMIGDPSDGIPGVGGVGEATARKVVQEMQRPDMESLLLAISRLSDTDKRVALLKDEEDVLRRNVRLIDLKAERFEWSELAELKKLIETPTVIDPHEFALWAQKFDLQSVMDFFVQYLETFRRVGGRNAQVVGVR